MSAASSSFTLSPTYDKAAWTAGIIGAGVVTGAGIAAVTTTPATIIAGSILVAMGTSIAYQQMAADQDSVYWRAMPYAIGSVSIGAVGLGVGLTTSSNALIVAAAIFGIMGTAAFWGVVVAGLASKNTKDFDELVLSSMTTAAFVAANQTIQFALQTVLEAAIKNIMNSKK